MKTEGAENDNNRSVWINCLVVRIPFSVLNGHHHEKSIKLFSASEQYFGDTMTSL